MPLPIGSKSGSNQYDIILRPGENLIGYTHKPESKESGIFASAMKWLGAGSEDFVEISIAVRDGARLIEHKVWVAVEDVLTHCKDSYPKEDLLKDNPESRALKLSRLFISEKSARREPVEKPAAAGGGASGGAGSVGEPSFGPIQALLNQRPSPSRTDKIIEALAIQKLELKKAKKIVANAPQIIEEHQALAAAALKIPDRKEAEIHARNAIAESYRQREAQKTINFLSKTIVLLENALKEPHS